VSTKMSVEVAFVAGLVVALGAGVAATDRRDARRRPSTMSVRRRRSSVAAGVDCGVTLHQRSPAEPPPALRARVPRPGAVPIRDVLAQFRLADERQSAAFQRPLAPLVHRRPVTPQVILPVRGVPTIGARVRLRRRPNAFGFDAPLSEIVVVGHLPSIESLARCRLCADDVTSVSMETTGVDFARLHYTEIVEIDEYGGPEGLCARVRPTAVKSRKIYQLSVTFETS